MPEMEIIFDSDELVALARIDIEKDRLDLALGKLKRAISMDKVPVEALGMIARLYAQIGLFDRAKLYFTQFLNQVPGAVNEAFQYGMVQFDSGDNSAALDTWKTLLEKHPEHPPARFYIGLAQAQAELIEEAKATLESLLSNIPVDNLYFGRAKELLQAIDRGESLAASAEPKAESTDLLSSKNNPYETEH